MKKLDWPLMANNITRYDLESLIRFLQTRNPILTHSKNVKAFEKEWSKWLGVKYSIFVNSGASANLLSIQAIREMYGLGEIIVPPLTWVSDIASVIQNGFKPIFADINPRTLGMDTDEIIKKITPK
ncbi:MAG: DegT/DnrJ/EryC1/StrS family aminotransferase, partial [Patescibacteria group bacterium]